MSTWAKKRHELGGSPLDTAGFNGIDPISWGITAFESMSPTNRYIMARDSAAAAKAQKLREQAAKYVAKNRDSKPAQAYSDELRARGMALPAGAPGQRDIHLNDKDQPNMLGPLLASGLGGGAAYLAAEGTGQGSKPVMDDRAAQVLKRYLRRAGVKLDVHPGHDPHFDPDRMRVGIRPRDRISTLAHEAGHATGSRKLIHAPYMGSKLYTMFGLPVALTFAHQVLGDTNFEDSPDEKQEKIRRAQTVAGALSLGSAPMIAEEGRAWLRGARMLAKLKKSPFAALKTLGAGALPFSTYLISGLVAPATSIALLEKRRREIERQGLKGSGHPKAA